MGSTPQRDDDNLRIFDTGAHPCGYFPERTARDLVLDPRDPRLPRFYPQALEWGFRRSGDLVYRPHCGQCRACIAVRIPVEDFVPDRSQRRCLRRNADLTMRVVAAQRTDEQLALYQRYLKARHRDGGMDDHGASEFEQFLVGAWAEGRFLEFRASGRLLAVAVTDRTDRALSAVYTFFDPDESARGLGTYAILRQLAWARDEELRHLYLGYWIEGHRKMDYKRRFRPLETFTGRGWRRLERGDDA
ncbi:MAG TPA: arginyltransferase [Luteimonas sp.]|nr:arginyltransferase [Luteimonas sp.]